MFHRVVYGAVDIEREPYLIPMARTSRNGNSKRFLRPHSNCNQHANSFFPWGLNYWNKLLGAFVDIQGRANYLYETEGRMVLKFLKFLNFLNFISLKYYVIFFILIIYTYKFYTDVML